MNRRSQLIIGLMVVALGIGAIVLATLEGNTTVRNVEAILADPDAHTRGTYTLLAVPQPPQVPVTSANGLEFRANPDYSAEIRSTISWSRDGQTYYSTRITRVEPLGEHVAWNFRNETRRLPSDPDTVFPVDERTWTTTGSLAFPVQAFDDGDGDTPRLWAIYDGPVKDPMQPKPSQFTGRLLTTLPDGKAVPAGAYIYQVEEYKAGCSSKFLPPEERQRLEDSGLA